MMRWLDGGQHAMMLALDHGPAHLPGEMFGGSSERILAAMKVHANTISHARLVAMEDTFPLTCERMGHEEFIAQARLFVEQSGAAARPLARIGEGFDRFLAMQDTPKEFSSLARLEWLWLEAYHAREAEPLALETLTSLGSQSLLAFSIARHPAAIAERFLPPVHDWVGMENDGLGRQGAILIARPNAEVMIHHADDLMISIIDAAARPIIVGQLIEGLLEPESDLDNAVVEIMQALARLVSAGAIIEA